MRRLTFKDDMVLQEWIEAVKEEDEFVLREQEMVKEMAKEIYRVEQRSAKNASVGRFVAAAKSSNGPMTAPATAQ